MKIWIASKNKSLFRRKVIYTTFNRLLKKTVSYNCGNDNKIFSPFIHSELSRNIKQSYMIISGKKRIKNASIDA